MSKFGFVGPTYQSQSPNANAELCMNWYVESMEGTGAKSAAVLYPTPGTAALSYGFIPGPVRGLFTVKNRLFSVIQNTLFEYTLYNGNVTANVLQAGLGDPLDTTSPVYFAANNANQMIMLIGGQLWCYPLVPGTYNSNNASTNISTVQTFYAQRNSEVKVTLSAPCPYAVGAMGTLQGLTTFTWLNGFQFTVDTVSGDYFTFYLGYRTGNVGPNSETGTAVAPANLPFTTAIQVNTAAGPFSFVDFIDSYFIVTYANSQEFQISNFEDGTNWDAADVAEIEYFPDNILSMIVNEEIIWFFGPTKTVPYYDTGNALFPFGPYENTVIEQGILAPNSRAKADNSIFWIGQDERGAGMAYRANGFNPLRISNHAVELAWSKYTTCADAIGFTYQDQGHTFWQLYFPTANVTWVYDIATNMWHRRDHFNQGMSIAHLSHCHAYWSGYHVVGDWRSSMVSNLSINVYDDFDTPGQAQVPIRRIRRSPHVSLEMEWMRHNQLQVYLQAGLANFTGYPAGPPFLIVSDLSGMAWKVQVNNAGAVLITSSTMTPETFIFQDEVNTTNYFQLFVSGNTLVANPVPVTNTYLTNVLMGTPDGTLQTGISIQNGLVNIGTPGVVERGPTASLRWSNDGGNTWTNYYTQDCGMVGDTTARVIWRRLGRAMDRVYELSVTDAAPWRIIDAYLKADPGYAPQERQAEMTRKSG